MPKNTQGANLAQAWWASRHKCYNQKQIKRRLLADGERNQYENSPPYKTKRPIPFLRTCRQHKQKTNMKNNGLSNRFSQETRAEWIYWYACNICGMNQYDALHHIICPSVRFYIKGKHNTSILNSCPIHNQKCHIGNEAHLYNDDTVKQLLQKTLTALLQMDYKLKPIDREYMTIYKDLYTPEDLKMIE